MEKINSQPLLSRWMVLLQTCAIYLPCWLDKKNNISNNLVKLGLVFIHNTIRVFRMRSVVKKHALTCELKKHVRVVTKINDLYKVF